MNFLNELRVVSGLDVPDHGGDVVDDSGPVGPQLQDVIDLHEREVLSLNVRMFEKQTEKKFEIGHSK